MSSGALEGLATGLEEVRDLQDANPVPKGGISALPRVTRAINRASVVMLSSHLEKYLYAVTEEAVLLVNAAGLAGDRLPVALRLQHSRQSIEDLSRTQWDNRATQLESFSQSEGWLWSAGLTGALDHERLLVWMRTPKAKQIVRLYRLWGIDDIFAEITRTPITRRRLGLKLDELVAKRNNIAHGDIAADATPKDIAAYIKSVWTFCERSDRRFARLLKRSIAASCSWY